MPYSTAKHLAAFDAIMSNLSTPKSTIEEMRECLKREWTAPDNIGYLEYYVYCVIAETEDVEDIQAELEEASKLLGFAAEHLLRTDLKDTDETE